MSLDKANCILQIYCGIVGFFDNDEELQDLCAEISNHDVDVVEESTAEYGDFQTNILFAKDIVNKIRNKKISPKIIIEPTCGKGNFIIASLSCFKDIERLYCIEIQKKYIWQTKFNILDFFLQNPNKLKPEIFIIHGNVFNFDFKHIKEILGDDEVLILGNPPWVTNSALSLMNSANIPPKSNFKQHRGFEAITGKGNFDISEYITIDLLKCFEKCNGHLAFLIKNSVIKNIVYDQPKTHLHISELQKQNIDSKKEFDVSVDASLFICKLNSNPSLVCEETDYYTSEKKCDFGWNNNRFMSDLSHVDLYGELDGVSPYEWRQGVKHDCSKAMELVRKDDGFMNKLGYVFEIEDDLVYPLLKSSDLKTDIAAPSRKYTIITQKFVGQDTEYIKHYPLTYSYLIKYMDCFKNRKSSIYKGKYDFSIFGIGDYSFKPYKIAISGLYKTYHFCLVKPQNGKPVMLDDTCYFIGFDTMEEAEKVWKILNTEMVSGFLRNIAFKDAKRMITKELLMRIDLIKISELQGIELKTDKKFIDSDNHQLCLF